MIKFDLRTTESARLPFHTVASLKERLAWLINLRWISIIALLFCVPVADKMFGFFIGFKAITNIAVILIIINLLYFLLQDTILSVTNIRSLLFLNFRY